MDARQIARPIPEEIPAQSYLHDIYQQYFMEFLPGIIGELMVENLKTLSCQVEISVTDCADAAWCLVVENGQLLRVARDGPVPQCRYLLDLETLVDVITAQCSPQDAFFEMRIEIEGDIERGLELSTVLGIFFERFPFTPRREA